MNKNNANITFATLLARISDHFIDTSCVLQTKQKICYLFSHKFSLSFMNFLYSFFANIIAAHAEGNDIYLALVQYPVS